MPAPGTDIEGTPRSVRGLPRSHRLKKRRLLRPLFGRRVPGNAQVRAAGVLMVARLAGRSELPPNVRVQLVTATRRGVRGIHRVRARRVLSEAFRVHVLTELGHEIDARLHPDEALTVLLMDVSRADSPPTVNRTGQALAARVPELLERLGR